MLFPHSPEKGKEGLELSLWWEEQNLYVFCSKASWSSWGMGVRWVQVEVGGLLLGPVYVGSALVVCSGLAM